MESRCETCSFRIKAEMKPDSLISKIWRWHTRWCLGWKAYQLELSKSPYKKGATY